MLIVKEVNKMNYRYRKIIQLEILSIFKQVCTFINQKSSLDQICYLVVLLRTFRVPTYLLRFKSKVDHCKMQSTTNLISNSFAYISELNILKNIINFNKILLLLSNYIQETKINLFNFSNRLISLHDTCDIHTVISK